MSERYLTPLPYSCLGAAVASLSPALPCAASWILQETEWECHLMLKRYLEIIAYGRSVLSDMSLEV